MNREENYQDDIYSVLIDYDITLIEVLNALSKIETENMELIRVDYTEDYFSL